MKIEGLGYKRKREISSKLRILHVIPTVLLLTFALVVGRSVLLFYIDT